tara:strand:- start:2631 stop:2876 length:246 start_codon:yes stop_codon:yes gene_type:complete
MDFTVVKEVRDIDADGNPTTENVTTNYVGSLEDNTFTVTCGGSKRVSQPWKPLPDGTRGEWEDLAEAVLWFQTNSNHITGE